MGPGDNEPRNIPSLHSLPTMFIDDDLDDDDDDEVDVDAETVKVDLASLGLQELDPEELATAEAFSIDSEPHTPPVELPSAEPRPIDWALIAAAAVGGLAGALAAVAWAIA